MALPSFWWLLSVLSVLGLMVASFNLCLLLHTAAFPLCVLVSLLRRKPVIAVGLLYSTVTSP